MRPIRHPYFVPGTHVLVWALLLGLPALLVRSNDYLGLPHLFFPVTSVYHIGVFYLNAFFLYPRLVNRKTWWLYVLSLVALAAVTNAAKLFFLRFDPAFQLTERNTGVILFGIVPFIVASILFRLVSDRLRYERLEKEARAEHLASELKFLRSQVSPHFLFNMMTSLVALARQRSALLEPSLIRLSELLRYMLHDSNEEKIPVQREIEHIENYVALQRLRFGEDTRIELAVDDAHAHGEIEPMLLIPFVENAFKHGIGMTADPFIMIRAQTTNSQLHFSVENNYNAANLVKDKASGIGLSNVRDRLKLLYPGKYDLQVQNENGIFSIHLTLDLS